MTEIQRLSRQEIMAALSKGSRNEILDALISACYWDKDWKWALQQLRRFSEHADATVLWTVATGVAFIAAFNGEIDEPEAHSILTRLKANANSSVAAAAEEAEADIEHFVENRQRGADVELVERRSIDRLALPREVSVTKPHNELRNNELRNSERQYQRPVASKHGATVGLIAAAMVLLFS